MTRRGLLSLLPLSAAVPAAAKTLGTKVRWESARKINDGRVTFEVQGSAHVWLSINEGPESLIAIVDSPDDRCYTECTTLRGFQFGPGDSCRLRFEADGKPLTLYNWGVKEALPGSTSHDY